MSSVYGPALLKDPEVADDVNTAIGRKKDKGEYETDHDRVKRIRRERKAQKLKDQEASQKKQMNAAIGSLLKPETEAVPFVSFGPGLPAGPSGPSGPERNTGRSSEAALVPGPQGPQGPQGPPAPPTPDAAVVDDTTSAGPAPATPPAASPVGPAPRPRGPMRPEPTEAVQARRALRGKRASRAPCCSQPVSCEVMCWLLAIWFFLLFEMYLGSNSVRLSKLRISPV